MPARITHVLKVKIGEVPKENGKPVAQYRDIGHVVEFTRRDGTGEPWEALRLPLDVLSPTLAAVVARHMPKGEGEVEVTKFRLDRRKNTGTGAQGSAAPATGADPDGGMEQEDAEW